MSKLLTVVLFLFCGSVNGTDCPDTWTAYDGSCYMFSKELVHFTEAEHYCLQHGAHLVKIDTQDENKFLEDFESSMINEFWLGLTDERIEGIWRWVVDESKVTYTDWGHGEGSVHNEDCAVIKNFRWHDYPCTANFSAVCEITIGEPVQSIVG